MAKRNSFLVAFAFLIGCDSHETHIVKPGLQFIAGGIGIQLCGDIEVAELCMIPPEDGEVCNKPFDLKHIENGPWSATICHSDGVEPPPLPSPSTSPSPSPSISPTPSPSLSPSPSPSPSPTPSPSPSGATDTSECGSDAIKLEVVAGKGLEWNGYLTRYLAHRPDGRPILIGRDGPLKICVRVNRAPFDGVGGVLQIVKYLNAHEVNEDLFLHQTAFEWCEIGESDRRVQIYNYVASGPRNSLPPGYYTNIFNILDNGAPHAESIGTADIPAGNKGMLIQPGKKCF